LRQKWSTALLCRYVRLPLSNANIRPAGKLPKRQQVCVYSCRHNARAGTLNAQGVLAGFLPVAWMERFPLGRLDWALTGRTNLLIMQKG
jgi:hypothetical protein